ncbi:MAG: STAS domain-containing protein, partial [Bacteroidaceae bacterium]|nr:STAS domain-containing protein [Bacteroidaceae bacterium]
VQPLLKQGATIVLNCEKMEYLSSSGLRVVLSTHKQITALGGRLIVRNLNNEVRSVFDLTGFSFMLKIE